MVRRLAPAVLCACAAMPLAAYGQAFPAKPIRMILALGGGAEVMARAAAKSAAELLGQPVVIETQSGAGGAIGAHTVARSAPDGYTILFAATNSNLYNVFLSKSTPYDPIRDFTPITRIGEAIICIVAHPSAPFGSLEALIERARRNPGQIAYGTSGIGTTHHLASERIKQIGGVDMVHVPYKGGGQVLIDLVGGRIPVAFTIYATAAPHLRSGKMKVLAVVNSTRYHLLPDVPTVRELLPAFERMPNWIGFFGPAGLTPPVLKRLNADLVKVLESAETRAKADEFGFAVLTSSPEAFAAAIKADLEIVAGIVKATGIKPE